MRDASAAPLTAIQLERVSHKFTSTDGRPVQAIRDVSLTVRENEFVTIVGPSGCGKSTMLRLVSGLISATDGLVKVFSTLVTEPRDRVGIVFQKPTLLPWLDVTSNVLFPARHKRGFVSEFDRQYARELLDLVGLSEFVKNNPDELSGGMQQRAAIARALLLDPKILLMDEPFSALDALTRDEMAFELLRIWSERPKTVLFITHSISEAILLSDRIFVMTPRPGTISEIIEVGLPRPRNMATLEDPLFQKISAHIRSTVFTRSRPA